MRLHSSCVWVGVWRLHSIVSVIIVRRALLNLDCAVPRWVLLSVVYSNSSVMEECLPVVVSVFFFFSFCLAISMSTESNYWQCARTCSGLWCAVWFICLGWIIKKESLLFLIISVFVSSLIQFSLYHRLTEGLMNEYIIFDRANN